MPNRLTDISVEFISLVKKGANRKHIILKGDGIPGVSKLVPVAKYDEELGIVYGLVYSPDEVDSQGDFAKADDIRKASHRFMKTMLQGNIDRDHTAEAVEAFVCESWILKGKDPLFPDEKEGAWAVGIQLLDDGLKEAVKKGEIAGLSMAGTAIREAAELEKSARSFQSAWAQTNLWEVMDALRESIRSILDDPDAADKAALLTESFNQCRETVLGRIKDAGAAPAEPAGPEKTEKKMEGIVEKIIKKIGGISNVKKQEGEGGTGALADVMTEGFEKVAATFEKLDERLKALEEARPVSKQDSTVPESEDVKKNRDDEALGADIAALVNG